MKVTLGTGELWMLLSPFGPAYILGLENPYRGWLIEEIEAEMPSVFKSLADRGIATIRNENELEIDDELLSMLELCARPNQVIVATLTKPGEESEVAFIHLGPEKAVLRTMQDDAVTLAGLQDRKAVFEYLAPVLRADSGAEAGGRSFVMPEPALLTARDHALAGSENEVVGALERGGVGRANAEKLAQALLRPIANSSIVVLSIAGTASQELQGLSILESEDSFFLLSPERDDQVRVRPSSPKKAGQLFKGYLG